MTKTNFIERIRKAATMDEMLDVMVEVLPIHAEGKLSDEEFREIDQEFILKMDSVRYHGRHHA